MANEGAARKVEVAIPEDVLGLVAEAAQPLDTQLLEAFLVDLFRRGEISSGRAARALGMTRWDFILLLGRHKVPYIDYEPGELAREVEAVRGGAGA